MATDEGTVLPFDSVIDDRENSEEGFASQLELDIVKNNDDSLLVFDSLIHNNVALYRKITGGPLKTPPPDTIIFSRSGGVANAYMYIGQVASNVTGANLPVAGSIVRVTVRDSGVQPYKVRVGFTGNPNTYPVNLAVSGGGFGNISYAIGAVPFTSDSQLRCYIEKVSNNKANNPIVMVSVRYD